MIRNWIYHVEGSPLKHGVSIFLIAGCYDIVKRSDNRLRGRKILCRSFIEETDFVASEEKKTGDVALRKH